MKLPSTLKKSVSVNRNLRDKLLAAYSTGRHAKLRDGESSAENFITRLNALVSFCFGFRIIAPLQRSVEIDEGRNMYFVRV